MIQTSHFCNKLWNLFKFGLGRLENEEATASYNILQPTSSTAQLSLVNRFILSRMADTITKCQQGFESYRLFDAADSVRRFIVEDVCDVYVEFAKASLNNKDVDAQEKVKGTSASANLTNSIASCDNVYGRRLRSLYCNRAWTSLFVWLILSCRLSQR